ncbi:MAG TPA: efflux RND transporter periplasmic adaptor subunit [Gemmataceae bacterium]|nr:efflux RND transporter periplasmic adaptor subunit [Gemmataceae bacterium]
MQSKRSGGKWSRWLLALAVLALLGMGGGYMIVRRTAATEDSPHNLQGLNSAGTISVEVASPRAGGMDRLCLQPGSVEPFESADLYTKVSGFLAEQKVDIGYPVQVGDVLARISVPEYKAQVKQDTADVVRAEARVDQMKAAIATAEADLGAATAAVALAKAEKKAKTSYRAYREKQLDRINRLVAQRSIDAKLADEHEDHHQAAIAADLAASEAVGAAKQKEAAAQARVKQAQADLRYAEAEVETSKARLEKSQVLLDYTVIRSPYTGVVTKRNFYPGDFIRAADSGGDHRVPLLAVERTDVMRVIIQVPERDVPFVNCGDPAAVIVDALPGEVFATRGTDKVEVSRLAASEDPVTRMMRTEVHVNNPDGKLRRGMFGRVTLTLQRGSAAAVQIPSSALVGKRDGKKGSVWLIREDKAALVPVVIGADNGAMVEILSGLMPADRVILRASAPLSEGAAVVAEEGQSSNGR